MKFFQKVEGARAEFEYALILEIYRKIRLRVSIVNESAGGSVVEKRAVIALNSRIIQ